MEIVFAQYTVRDVYLLRICLKSVNLFSLPSVTFYNHRYYNFVGYHRSYLINTFKELLISKLPAKYAIQNALNIKVIYSRNYFGQVGLIS